MGSGRSTLMVSFSSACSTARRAGWIAWLAGCAAAGRAVLARAVDRGAGAAVIFSSPASQRIADTDSGGHWPIDHPCSSSDSEAGPEAKALVGDVTKQGQVNPGGLMIMLMFLLMMIAVVGRAVSGWPSPGVAASLLIHHYRVRGGAMAAHHPVRMMCCRRYALTMAR